MSQTIPFVNYKLTDEKLLVDPRLKICIECGQSKIESYEFGISCEICGILHIFDPGKPSQNSLVVEA